MRRSASTCGRALAGCTAGLLGALLPACAGPGPRYFPPAPLWNESGPDGTILRGFDIDGDGRAEYREVIGESGRIQRLEFDTDGDGEIDESVSRWGAPGGALVLDWWASQAGPTARLPAADPSARHLLVVLDSTPFEIVRDLWNQGRLRLFAPPSRVIAPFPVMTDPSLAEFFGVSPCLAVESEYYNGQRLQPGMRNYLVERNAPWVAAIDYHLPPDAHGWAYLFPGLWFRHDLGRIEEHVLTRSGGDFSAYVVSTSGLGSQRGRDGHMAALLAVERLCQGLMYRTRGRLEITLVSDHGHNLVPSRRVSLPEQLQRCGYRARDRIETPQDVVVPEFGLVSYAAIYTRSPAAVARDVVGLEGVELACYAERPAGADEGGVRLPPGRVIVLSRSGRAVIEREGEAFRYVPHFEDPLGLAAVLAELRELGRLDGRGFAPDSDWFTATAEHEYPDALYRLWRAFDGLCVYTPDVLVSLADGYYAGSARLADFIAMKAVHGNLNRRGSSGFVMSTAGELPPVLRITQVREALARIGVRVRPSPGGGVSARTPFCRPSLPVEHAPALRSEDREDAQNR